MSIKYKQAPIKVIKYFMFCVFCSVVLQVNAEIGEKLMAKANGGDAASQYTVGRYYELGIGVKRDYAQAFTWYQKAGNLNYNEAVYRLGFFYYKGVGDVKKSYEKAFEYFTKAAEGNHSQAQEYLAEMYKNGYGVKADEEKANFWYTKSFNNEFNAFNDAADASEPEPEKKKPAPVVVKAAVKATPVKAKPEPQVVRDSNAIDDLNANEFKKLVLNSQWKTNGDASMYFNSAMTKCKQRKNKLSCMSEKVNGVHPTGLFKYKIKTIMTGFDNRGRFSVTYRRLIVSVPDFSGGAYDEDVSATAATNQNLLKTGWENAINRMPCEFDNRKQFTCTAKGGEKLVSRS